MCDMYAIDINFKYSVLLSSKIGEVKHRIEVFTQTDLVDEFLAAVYSVASENWNIESYAIVWNEQF